MWQKFKIFIPFLFVYFTSNSQSLFDSIGYSSFDKTLHSDKITFAFNYYENELLISPEKAKTVLIKIKKYLPENNNLKQWDKFYFYLADYYYLIQKYDSAEYYYNIAIADIKTTTSKLTINSLIKLSLISIKNEDLFEAKRYLNRASLIAINTENPLCMGLVYQQQANVFMFEESYSEASSFFQKAINRYRSENDTIRISSIYTDLAQMYAAIRNYPLAIDYLEKAEKVFVKSNYIYKLAINQLQMGKIYIKSTKYNDALLYLTKSEKLFNKLNNKRAISMVYNQMGKAYEKLRYFDKSLIYLNRALEKNINNILESSKILSNKGDLYTAKGEIISGQKFYLNSLQLAENINNKELKLYLYAKLLNNYSVLNDYKNAYKFQILYHALDHDIIIKKSQSSLTQLDSKLKEEITYIENEKNALQKEISYLSDRKQQKVIFFTLFIVVLLFVLVTLTYLIFTQKKRNGILVKNLQNTIKSLHSIEKKSNLKLEKLKKSSDRIFKITTKNMWEPYLVLERLATQISSDTEAKKISVNKTNFDNDQLVMALNLLDNVLFWAKNQLGMIELHPELFKINYFIDSIIKTQKLRATAKNIKIVYICDSNIMVYADKNTLKFTLRNIIENAIKFSTTNSEVSIIVINKYSSVEIKIIDVGVGMTKEQINTLFSAEKPYMSLSTDGEKGGGLGLALSKEFVERNFGTLRLKSSIALGTTASIVLPSTPSNLWLK